MLLRSGARTCEGRRRRFAAAAAAALDDGDASLLSAALRRVSRVRWTSSTWPPPVFSRSFAGVGSVSAASSVTGSLAQVVGPGLYGNKGLECPGDFEAFAGRHSEHVAQLLVGLVDGTHGDRTCEVMDEISVTLCRAVDLAELCRTTHSDPRWRESATKAVVELQTYLADLNADERIAEAMARRLDAVKRGGGEGADVSEERAVLESLLNDATRGGVAVPEPLRGDVKALVLRGMELGVEFSGRIVEGGEVGPVAVSRKAVEDGMASIGLRPGLCSLVDVAEEEPIPEGETMVQRLERWEREALREGTSARATLTAPAYVIKWLLRSVPDGETRKRLHAAVMTQNPENLETLDRLLDARHGLARTLQYDSYSHMIAETGLSAASSPGAVRDTLERLSRLLRPAGDREVRLLASAKAAHEGLPSSDALPPVFSWDRPFYEERMRAEEDARGRHNRMVDVSPYLSVQAVREGLFGLTQALFGVRVESAGMRPSETWAPSMQVTKFALVQEGDSLRGDTLLGHIYLDLFGRPGKNGHPSLFGLSSSRHIPSGSAEEVAQRAAYGDRAPADRGVTQSCLVMGLDPREGRRGGGFDTALMTWDEAKSLFHEWGHALHHTLSATRFQHLSGTRAAMDWIEVPSTLMEHFFRDPRVAQGFMRHVRTGEPLPEGALEEVLRRDNRFSALFHQEQLGLALVDLDLHAPETRRAASAGHTQATTTTTTTTTPTTTSRYHAIMDSVCSIAPAEGTFPHARASHYVGYPGQYYSYIYARCLAAQVWSGLFAPDPFSRDAGDKFRRLCLAPGGAKPALDIFRDTMDGQDPSVKAFVENVAGPEALVGVPEADLRLCFHAD